MTDLLQLSDSQSQLDGQERPLVFLEHLQERDWVALISYADHHEFLADEELARAGSTDRSLLLLLRGTVASWPPSADPAVDQPYTEIEAPAVIGEVAFLDGQPRSMTIHAREDGELLALRPERFNQLASENPKLAATVLADLGRILALRLRLATELIETR